MGQQSLIYSFVARGGVVIAEFSQFTGNFSTIAAQCLQKLPPNNNKFTYTCDQHTFNYLVEDGFSKCLLIIIIVMKCLLIGFCFCSSAFWCY